MSKFEIVEFETYRGEKVVKAFLEKQSAHVQAYALRLIDMLKYGPNLGMPYSRKISKDLYELRIKGREAVRILYTCRYSKIYLLHAFKKKTQKIPTREINIALKRVDTI